MYRYCAFCVLYSVFKFEAFKKLKQLLQTFPSNAIYSFTFVTSSSLIRHLHFKFFFEKNFQYIQTERYKYKFHKCEISVINSPLIINR